MGTKIIAIIPARYKSTRFRGKILAEIAGQTMIERVYRQVEKAKRFSDIIVATDNIEIKKKVRQFGGSCVMTPEHIKSGTDRVWEVLRKSNFDAAINIQGDEPLISEKLIANLYDMLETVNYGVLSAAYFNSSYEDFQSRNIVKLVLNENSQAIYFSRSPIPFMPFSEFCGFYQHIGIYGYMRDSLEKFVHYAPSELEKIEKLEQLRFLVYGINIKIIQSEYKSIGVDVPEDIKEIEKILIKKDEKN